MIKYGEVNPLNVHNIRLTDHCLLHFTTIDFDIRTSEKMITDWIYENLSGRFWIGDYYSVSQTGSIVSNKRVAFELPSEASYFGIFLDSINKHPIW